ncbi:ubiquitin carboxyl-terminal hydrolase family protein, putative [Ichthyophthirius multifiliis]|uniref:Ubiquitin carboxyl-terminal hydrolase family protein, putative n=1 Tax=Ichthyophthirius multifiliis TaxID=5932 RepID=G0QN88_ICHMU|nr:ubiquitin carboxyl-terminal hydrolase family protein, putative [Ichthyophthirius multifiliis]EGR33325.1 ubiquitin carboxyl-terminal hydrolase family protein, putative [Ichthyophthirius multifiliis]|eukprot:XP_004037311.1 ubiquitin carboxyl-terminal hydrolase family protein, putative [Ichthyophthirius multifiliis]
MNNQLFKDKNQLQQYHIIPNEMQESKYNNIFLKDNFSINDVKLVDFQTWIFFKEQYKDSIEIPCQVLKIKNEYIHAAEFEKPYIGFLDQEVFEKIKDNQNQEENIYNFKRLQIPNCFDWKLIVDYIKKLYSFQKNISLDSIQIRVWKIEQAIPLNSVIKMLNKNIQDEKFNETPGYLYRGVNDENCYRYMKKHYKYLVEVQNLNKDKWILEENTNFKFSMKKGQKVTFICEFCEEQTILIEECQCKQYFYCSNECKYRDKPFHSKLCANAYFSESDEEYDDKKIEKNTKKKGLENLENTCYLNSALQCILSTDEINKFYSQNEYKEHLKKIKKYEK